MSTQPRKTVMSVFNLRPNVAGSLQLFAAELSRQLSQAGCKSVLVFLEPPTQEVAALFDLPNTCVETLDGRASIGSLLHMRQLIRKHRPAVVHSHLVDSPCLTSWLVRGCGVASAYVTDHISRPVGGTTASTSAWKRVFRRVAYAPVTRMVCVSDYVFGCQIKKGVMSESRICRMYNGIDLARADAGQIKRGEFRQRRRIPNDAIVVLQASWLVPEKGLDDLLAAARIVLAQCEKAHFVLAGDGPCRREYEQKARQLGIDRSVTFTGVVTDPLGDGLFAAADVVCQLSRWQEAFGLTIAEAMASGKPVVGTRVGAIPELIVDGETGYLVDRGDVPAIAERILTLANDPPLRKSLGEAGKRRCQEKFDLVANVAALIKEYGIC